MAFVRFTRRRRISFIRIFLLCCVVVIFAFWLYSRRTHKYVGEIEEDEHKGAIPPPKPENDPESSFREKNFYRMFPTKKHSVFEKLALMKKLNKQNKNAIYKKKDESIVKHPRASQSPFIHRPNFTLPPSKVTPGLGENGVPVHLSAQEQKLADEVFGEAAFNVYLSDRIPLNRSVPDSRNEKCKYETYDTNLPSASVVIIFTNEIWSALLRTIHSVINRTPQHLLHEIVLVDDFSDKDDLKNSLPLYINQQFRPSFIKLKRFNERRGLIHARLEGAKIATGDVLIFLDSHCEANVQWIEPLLQRIKDERKSVLCPVIDVIDDRTFEYFASNQEYFQIGGFTWNGHFNWIEIPDREELRRKSEISPARTPTMAGGLFAIDRKYFWDIGSYDSGMEIWGGENLEMSFRIWQCGGFLEIVPCSHVGHVFRSFHPYKFPGNKDTHGINTVRTVEVWMDDYKKYFYHHRPDLQKTHYGDISQRFQLKKELKCKSFQWYLDEIYPEKFIFDKGVSAYGTLRNPVKNLCLDTLNRDEDKSEPIGYFNCKHGPHIVINQLISYTLKGELRIEENCATVHDEVGRQSELTVFMSKCQGTENQKWVHKKGGSMRHKKTGKCLDVSKKKSEDSGVVRNCHNGHFQTWWFEHYLSPNLEIKSL